MLSHPLPFELSVEWRVWKNQWFKYVLLLVGFALFATLLALGLKTGELLFLDPPAWVDNKNHRNLYTLTRYHQSGGVSTVSKKTIDTLSNIPGVKAIAYVAFRTYDVIHDDRTTFDGAKVAYISRSFKDQITLKFPEEINTSAQQQAWISDRFFKEAFNSNPSVIGSHFRVKRNPHPFIIVGVLPAEMNHMGKEWPDLWVDSSNLRYHTPFTVPLPGKPDPGQEKILNRFLMSAPIYYAVFSLSNNIDPQTIEETIKSNFTEDPKMRMNLAGAEISVRSGIVFDPDRRKALQNQWLVVLVLIITFGVILAINALTLFSSQAVLHWKSFLTRKILGASQKYFLYSALVGLAIPMAFVAVLSFVLLVLCEHLVNISDLHLAFVGDIRFSVSMGIWASALFATCFILYLCKGLQVISFSEDNLFDRSIGNNKGRLQHLISRALLGVQLTAGFLTAATAASMALSEWQSQNAVNLDQSVIEILVSHSGNARPPSEVYKGELSSVSSAMVAASIPSFQKPATGSVKKTSDANNIATNILYVSENYFDLLGAQEIKMPAQWRQGVVVNKNLADMLVNNNDYSSLVGSTLAVQGIQTETYIVEGIIGNVPHFGVSPLGDPMVYLPLSDATTFKGMAFLSQGQHVEALHNRINLWVESDLVNAKIKAPISLGQIIADMDSLRLGFLKAILLTGLLINGLIFISISYQIKARMAIVEHEYGVRMVYGCSAIRLILVACKESFQALLLAVPISIIVMWWLNSRFSSFLDIDILRLDVLPSVLIIIVLLILLSATLPVISLLNKPLVSLMRET